MTVSSNGAIDIFNIATNELLYQYFLPRTAVNICAFDKYVNGRDVLCIAPSGSIFHIRWEDLPPSSFNEEIEEDERIRRIFSKDPKLIYQNNDVTNRLFCAGIDSKYNYGVIGSLISYPPRGHLLIYNPNVNAKSGGNIGNGIHGFNEIRTKSGTLPRTNDDSTSTVVFSVLDIDEERVVASCTRGWIYCFEFKVNQKENQEEKEEAEETREIKQEDETIFEEKQINKTFGRRERFNEQYKSEDAVESLIKDLYKGVLRRKKFD
jgi:hypothetical protein